ncbi:hypothetical protein LOTGIDRAFT_228846 [Lottia gigantea]|uniref:non-specific serine/threonine protein kinase n=1 Tax=Lottia gigantea TaxID=225164 RepID=V4BRD6_LOTGI|nr:hypothetical protein LOTGIDRAFT_228846 [Lottia gigantea]ESO91424.1 hypothetical protein LOTGIDRAFT_228846 [Lottia gigantea]
MAQIYQGTHFDTYISELPYSVTRSIIVSLDSDKAWECLASEAGYSFDKIKLFELEYQRHHGSPAKALLWDWGSRNTTVKELYYKLKKINRIRELQILENHLVSVGAIEEQENSHNSYNNSIDIMPSLKTSDLPSPSQKQKIKSDKVALLENEVNFNQPNSQNFGRKKNPTSLCSIDKDKQYDDKVIPGQEQTAHHKPQESEESFESTTSSSFSADLSSSKSSSLTNNSSSQSEDLQSLLTNSNMSVAVALMGSPVFKFEELKKSTDNFNEQNLLGEGAFGKVYFSCLRECKCAIKKLDAATSDILSNNEEKRRKLCSELSLLLKYRHENIVTLYGYAVDGPSLCLVYQHMVNGSLEDCIQMKNGRLALNWEQRLRILCGAVCGLRYLHYMGNVPLIHGDIKSANILLDKYHEAKIGDLGQAQHVNSGAITGKLTHITKKDAKSKLYGTKAYLSPELLRGNENMSIKTDIYAFGVVILETLSGQPACDENRTSSKFLADYFFDVIEPLGQDEWVDKFHDHKAGPPPTDLIFDILKLAVSCISQIKKKRPDTDKVAENLEKNQKKFMDVYSSTTSSLGYDHLSHTSVVSGHDGNMAGNMASVSKDSVLKENASPGTPPLESIPYRLQMMYDQQQSGDGPHTSIEDLKKQIQTESKTEEPFKEYVSDPAKMAAIENYDKELKLAQQEQPKEFEKESEPASDPNKLALLNLFDRKCTISESENSNVGSDEHKLKAILEFDAQNVGESQSLQNKMVNMFKMYNACIDVEEDDDDDDASTLVGDQDENNDDETCDQ